MPTLAGSIFNSANCAQNEGGTSKLSFGVENWAPIDIKIKIRRIGFAAFGIRWRPKKDDQASRLAIVIKPKPEKLAGPICYVRVFDSVHSLPAAESLR
jgi:hypothetical protein